MTDRQWRVGRSRSGVLTALLAAGFLIFCGIGSAGAKPSGAQVAPDALTLKYTMEPLPPLGEPIPGAITEGRAFYGKLISTRSACRTGRVVYARYEFPPYGGEPLIRPMWGDGGGKIKTNGRGVWKAEPVVFAGMAYRVTAFVKRKSVSCPQVESKPLTLPPG